MQAAEEKCSGVFSLNGDFSPNGTSAVSPQDLAMVQGQAIFETLAIYEGKLFAAERHWKRLRRGAELFGLRTPPPSELEPGISAVMNANQLGTTAKDRARVTLTAGEPIQGFKNDSGRTNVIIEVSPAPSYSAAASVITVPFARNQKGALSGLKTINYGENAVAMQLARKSNAHEAIFPNTTGEVCEGTWSNFFCCLDGELITPPLESGCLPGVTREIILELATDLGIEIAERSIAIGDLDRIEAAALTSSLRELQPVLTIDGRTLSVEKFDTWNTISKAYQQFVRDS